MVGGRRAGPSRATSTPPGAGQQALRKSRPPPGTRASGGLSGPLDGSPGQGSCGQPVSVWTGSAGPGERRSHGHRERTAALPRGFSSPAPVPGPVAAASGVRGLEGHIQWCPKRRLAGSEAPGLGAEWPGPGLRLPAASGGSGGEGWGEGQAGAAGHRRERRKPASLGGGLARDAICRQVCRSPQPLRAGVPSLGARGFSGPAPPHGSCGLGGLRTWGVACRRSKGGICRAGVGTRGAAFPLVTAQEWFTRGSPARCAREPLFLGATLPVPLPRSWLPRDRRSWMGSLLTPPPPPLSRQPPAALAVTRRCCWPSAPATSVSPHVAWETFRGAGSWGRSLPRTLGGALLPVVIVTGNRSRVTFVYRGGGDANGSSERVGILLGQPRSTALQALTLAAPEPVLIGSPWAVQRGPWPGGAGAHDAGAGPALSAPSPEGRSGHQPGPGCGPACVPGLLSSSCPLCSGPTGRGAAPGVVHLPRLLVPS